MEVPRPAPDQALVKVAAAGVNRADLLQRMGHYPPPQGESDILGLEIAGTICELGVGAEGWRIGDRVMTLVGGGGYAEYAVAPLATLLPVPEGMDLTTAAGVTETFTTVYLNLFREGGLQSGQNVLIHGGGSSIGTTAIQLAKSLVDSRVFVTVGDGDKAERCRALGADHAINYKEDDFSREIKALTKGEGVDLILDHIGGAYLGANLDCLALRGRLVIIGLMGGNRSELDLGLLMRRRLTVAGSVLRARSVAEKAAITEEIRERVIPLLVKGDVRPVVHSVLPLERASEAHGLLADNKNFGKVVLRVTAS
jgi:putative PIG3 family NAD(P)H quinone oxidoreductase